MVIWGSKWCFAAFWQLLTTDPFSATRIFCTRPECAAGTSSGTQPLERCSVWPPPRMAQPAWQKDSFNDSTNYRKPVGSRWFFFWFFNLEVTHLLQNWCVLSGPRWVCVWYCQLSPGLVTANSDDILLDDIFLNLISRESALYTDSVIVCNYV